MSTGGVEPKNHWLSDKGTKRAKMLANNEDIQRFLIWLLIYFKMKRLNLAQKTQRADNFEKVRADLEFLDARLILAPQLLLNSGEETAKGCENKGLLKFNHCLGRSIGCLTHVVERCVVCMEDESICNFSAMTRIHHMCAYVRTLYSTTLFTSLRMTALSVLIQSMIAFRKNVETSVTKLWTDENLFY